ncbi:glycosyltransferase family 4 protein [Acidobacteria bacterium AB60]|nr:glycosyltransferase family 4 protein [Acidobacteria bacterium AB60]
MSERPRVGYDGRLAIEPFRGMGRYLRTLIGARQGSLIGFCARGESSESLALIGEGARSYPLWEQWSLPKQISRYGIDVFIAPYNTAPLRLPANVRLVLIVHDLIFLDPAPLSHSLYQNAGRAYRRLVVPRALHNAHCILTVSDFTKSQIMRRFGISAEAIRVIPCSIGAGWFRNNRGSNSTEHCIFTVTGEAPSKNLGRGIQAFARLARITGDSALTFRIAGVKSKFHNQFKRLAEHLGVASQVQLYGYLSEDALREAYRKAKLFFMPSISEGFGIPVLEAMANRLPLALSRGGSLPEVGGDAALYFDPYSIEDMAQVMRRVLIDTTAREELVACGTKRVRAFTEEAVRPPIEEFWRSIL